eukprot:771067-Alexandrium_andersonii.AAC.1
MVMAMAEAMVLAMMVAMFMVVAMLMVAAMCMVMALWMHMRYAGREACVTLQVVAGQSTGIQQEELMLEMMAKM